MANCQTLQVLDPLWHKQMGATRKIIIIKANADNHGDNDDDDDDDDNEDHDDTEVEDFALMVEKNESKPEDRASPILLSFEFENVDGDPGGL